MRLTVSSLNKQYVHRSGVIRVLLGIDMEMPPGESLSIVGASGAGKSTLLHIVGTLDKPSSGAVSYDGRDVFAANGVALAEFRNRNIGFVFQAFYLLPEFTAVENVMIPALIGGIETQDARRRAEGILERVGLGHRLTHRPGELSGGEQQRVAMARALVMDPKVLIADEPTGNLDQQTGEEVFALLKSLQQERGMTLLMATHNMRLAESMDRVYRLEGGLLHPLK